MVQVQRLDPKTLLLPAVMALLVACIPLGRMHAQENPARLDSVLPLLDATKKDTVQLTLLIWVAESWTTSPVAMPYLRRLDSLSNELLRDPEPRVRKKALHARGAFHFFIGYHAKFERNIPLALSSFHRAVRDFGAGGHLHAVGESQDALGITLRVVGSLEKAEDAFREELRIAKDIGDDKLMDQALVHLAGVMADRGDLALAEAHLDACASGTPEDSSAVLNARARIMLLRKRPDEAEKLLVKSLSIAKRSDNPWDQLPVLAPLARILLQQDRPKDGIAYALQCANLAKEMGDPAAQCACIVLVGMGERQRGDAARAEVLLKDGLALAERNRNVGVARELGDEGSMLFAAAQLKELYKAQGRTADALAMTDRWALLKDSVEHMNGRDEVRLIEFHGEQLRDSLVHASALSQAAVQGERNVADERNRRNMVLCGAIVLGLAIIALWSRLRLVRRTRDAIVEAQEKLVSAEKQREAAQVRTRIARDVHDQLGSDLTKLSMLGTEMKASVRDDPSALAALAHDIDRLASEAGRSLSDIVWAVDPQHDSMVGLMDRARQFCERMLGNSGIAHTIECVVEGRDHPIDPATKRDLYLILRETLNNAIKYAQATSIDVRFNSREDRVRLQVTDNGKGFNMMHAMRNGNGLRNVKERAERLGAELVIASEPGGGTLVRLDAKVTMTTLLPRAVH